MIDEQISQGEPFFKTKNSMMYLGNSLDFMHMVGTGGVESTVNYFSLNPSDSRKKLES